MAETYNRLNLDVNVKPGGIITAVQKDSDSRYLDVNLFNNGVPIDLTGHEVRIYMRKPENGGEIFNDGEITEPENGRCQFLLTTAALEKVGHLQTQISIWKDNKEILSTQIFEIDVTESLRTTGSIEGSNEYGALVVLFQNLYESMDLMTDMVQNFGTAGEVAAGIPADTFWKMLEAVYQVNKDALENASVSEVLNRIGLTADTGGSQTEGTVFAKENEILSRIEDLEERQKTLFKEQIWGQWTAEGTISTRIAVPGSSIGTGTITVPEGAWFTYLRTRMSAYTSSEGAPSGHIEGTIIIEGKTYPISATISTNNPYSFFIVGPTGFKFDRTSANPNPVLDGIIPIYPRFEGGEINVSMQINPSQGESYNGTAFVEVLIGYLVSEE